MSEVTQAFARIQSPAERLAALARTYGTTIVVALVVFLVAYDNGGFGESTRDTLGIALWWVLILCVGLAVWPLARIPRAAWAVGGLVTAVGLWTLLSVVWAADSAGAYAEFTRVMLYLAVFAVVVAGSRRDNAGRWLDGLALGIVAVTVVTLVSRFFPGTLEQREIARLLAGAQTRLSFPVGYWNGLATLVALGIPLLLRVAVAGRSVVVRGAAVLPIPAICGVIYLTSSRLGVLSALVGTTVFVLLTPNRWRALGAAVAAAAGGAAVVLALNQRNTLVNGPLDSPLAASQGHSALLIVLGVCVLASLLYGIGSRAVEGRVRTSAVAGWAIVGIAVAAVMAAVVAAHPIRRFEEFKNPTINLSTSSAIQQHLLSTSGNGRWQLWSSAVDEFTSSPFHGTGAGSFEAWWTQHESIPLFVQDAHSLYAETLGELGIVGFLLLFASFVVALVVGARRLARAGDDQRSALAAALSVFVAFLVAAAFDWVWELTIVGVVAFASLALLVGAATSPARGPRRVGADEEAPDRNRLARYALGAGVIVGGWLVICALAIPVLAGAKMSTSQDAARRGDLVAAVRDALAARDIQPWSSLPYQQLALLEEQAGNYATALGWARKALSRDDSDWRLWLIMSRLQAELGHVRGARHALARLRILYPRYSLFQGVR